MGYDLTGSVQLFDEDGDLLAGGEKMKEIIVLPFSRLLVKDEIKKETFEMKLDVTDHVVAAQPQAAGDLLTISDLGASTEYRVNSPAGEYGILYAPQNGILLDIAGNADHKATIDSVDYLRCGLIFYQAGIVVLTGSVFGSLLQAPLDAITADFWNDGSNIGIDDVFKDNSTQNQQHSIQQHYRVELNCLLLSR